MALLLKNGNPLKKLIYHAREILFDNSDTSLEATDVQSAIEELDGNTVKYRDKLVTVGSNNGLIEIAPNSNEKIISIVPYTNDIVVVPFRGDSGRGWYGRAISWSSFSSVASGTYVNLRIYYIE